VGAHASRSDKISGHGDQIGLEPVDNINCFAQGDDGKIVIVMNIAQLRDPESVPGFGQTWQADFDRHQLGPIGLEDEAIAHDAQGTDRSSSRTDLQQPSPRRKQ